MLMTIFIPGIKVKALTGNDGVEYPDKPEDVFTDYFVFYSSYSDSRFRGTFMVTFNSSDGPYVTSSYYNGGVEISIFTLPRCHGNNPDYDNGLCDHGDKSENLYKENGNFWNVYRLEDNLWKIFDYPVSGSYFGLSSITKLLYSTVDIYYAPDAAKSTYPESSYFIPGEHYVDRSLKGLEYSYGDKTYNKNIPKPKAELNITDARVNDVDNNREFYLVNFDLGDYYDSKYKLYYGYDVNTQTKYSAEFNQETKKATIKHAFDSVPIYYQLIENDNLSSPVLTGVYSVPIGYTNQNKEIIIKEANSYDDNGNKIITATLDFSNIEKFRDIHPDITYIIDDVIVTDTNYNWTITKDNFSSFYAKHIRVFLGQYSVINEGYYHPKWEGGFTKKPEETPTIPNFDDKYTDVVERELLEQVDMNDLDNGPGIVKMVKAFVGAIKDFIISFFKIIINFFNKLNIWIRACIISLFCIFIISRIIKAVRK